MPSQYLPRLQYNDALSRPEIIAIRQAGSELEAGTDNYPPRSTLSAARYAWLNIFPKDKPSSLGKW